MIKKIENGDVSRVAGGEIHEVLMLGGPGDHKAREGARFVVVDPLYPKFLMEERSFTAAEAKEIERKWFGENAQTDGYVALTGKWKHFES